MKRSSWVWIQVCVVLGMGMLALPLSPSYSTRGPTETESPQSPGRTTPGLGLAPERQIAFTTDEGTWLSVDVSPDGRTIVFDLLGDLYDLPVEGGQARRLTSGMGFDSQPRYSPDGKWIAFISDRGGAENLWVAQEDGSEPYSVTNYPHARMASPVWTPDGEYIIVSRDTDVREMAQNFGIFELWMYHVNGGTGVQLTKAKNNPDTPEQQQKNTLGPEVSSDGRYLYYTQRVGHGFGSGIFPTWQIIRRDLLEGTEKVITKSGISALRPVLSPDASKLVYGTRHDGETGLRVRHLSSGEDRWLKYPVQRDDQLTRASRDLLPGYSFTPGGKAIIVSYGGRIFRVDVDTGQERLIPFTAAVSLDLGPLLDFPARIEDGPVQARVIQDPSQSPDGKRLVFSAFTRLYVMGLPDGTPARLTTAEVPEYQPTWSPRGEWVAYVTWSRGEGHLWKVRSDGREGPVRLTQEGAFYRDPVWSPDGSRIVVLRARQRQRLVQTNLNFTFSGYDLIWLPAEGGEARVIAEGLGGQAAVSHPIRSVGKPHFSREHDRVYVHLNSEGLVSMRFDGTDKRTHLHVRGKYWNPQRAQDVRISPDGRWALALVNFQPFVVAVPPVAETIPTVLANYSATPPAPVPVKRLSDVGADYIAWADGGSTVTWGLGSTFFRQSLEMILPGQRGNRSRAAFGQERSSVPEAIQVAVTQPRHRPRGTIVLRGAQVITMRGDEIIQNADVVVTDNRIVGVGQRGEVAIPDGARVLDLDGATIVPGFIDTHSHFRIPRGILDPQHWNFHVNLAYGVTTGRDPQAFTDDLFIYHDLVETGAMLGPRLFTTGPGVFRGNDFQSLPETKKVVSKYRRYYRTKTLKSYNVGNRRQRQWMIQACREYEIMPTTEGAGDLEMDLTHAIDGFSGNEHSFPIVPLFKDVVELVARSKMTYTPTLVSATGGPLLGRYFVPISNVHENPKMRRFVPHRYLDFRTSGRRWYRDDEHVYKKLAAAAAKIVHAGGRITVGSHGNMQGLGYHWEMWGLATGGLTNLEVLRAATLAGAEAIGYAHDLGSIEVDKLADLVVLTEDPLQNIRNTDTILYVMKNGELFDGNTLDQVWPEKRSFEPPTWWDDTPQGY